MSKALTRTRAFRLKTSVGTGPCRDGSRFDGCAGCEVSIFNFQRKISGQAAAQGLQLCQFGFP
jgi:hypothetical protein